MTAPRDPDPYANLTPPYGEHPADRGRDINLDGFSSLPAHDPATCRRCVPRAEGLREALEHVLDVWPAPSPEEFARLHRVLTGQDSCSSRPSDERVPESEER